MSFTLIFFDSCVFIQSGTLLMSTLAVIPPPFLILKEVPLAFLYVQFDGFICISLRNVLNVNRKLLPLFIFCLFSSSSSELRCFRLDLSCLTLDIGRPDSVSSKLTSWCPYFVWNVRHRFWCLMVGLWTTKQFCQGSSYPIFRGFLFCDSQRKSFQIFTSTFFVQFLLWRSF